MIKITHLDFQTKYPKCYFFNITEDLRNFVKESTIKNGTITIQSEHTTCGVFFEEYMHDEDPKGHDFLQVDLLKCLRTVFPDETEFNDYYKYPGPVHMTREGRPTPEYEGVALNGPAHLEATVIRASQTFVIEDGVIQTGQFGSIWFVDFDYNRPRKRHCVVCVMGE